MQHLTELNNLITEFYDKMSSWELSVVKETGYSLAQIHTLEVLGSHGAMRMKELANRLSITTGTLTVQVEKLVQAGLIERQSLEGDRRSIVVDLTEQGQSVYREHNALHIALTQDLTRHFTEQQHQALVQMLTQMNKEF
ncbi:MarR family winged helix-turn-helix transcriptional regulator [Vibrio fluvialis]|jgi:DNA-binding MarR family transcriptional regulator|uniref:Transcriptional regulator n=1 Tax=Vibrio fluvialis TaxID=676 RepID=A0AAX2LWP8_VIBFL|nr:MarR family transcriptional regulator [Vibrio fluvialis]AMF93147.1 MarR family transcriptional regulator [Vibrio fluvialis]EKO3385377.1 MarR family transcriptional regulator [Vibrio fluvialis]EKO3411331.1 MarR family transcriptional regulator [Vibrio fluvialis]EKO3442582.1 MarR family transcriptional regulator [Vibrio fluvialis]EKO3482099.1 MarR family transcriptional regulator [Vibrio fluvialis]